MTGVLHRSLPILERRNMLDGNVTYGGRDGLHWRRYSCSMNDIYHVNGETSARTVNLPRGIGFPPISDKVDEHMAHYLDSVRNALLMTVAILALKRK